MKVSEIGEFGLIRELTELIEQLKNPDLRPWKKLLINIGDDTAAWKSDAPVILATTDCLIQDIHFNLKISTWEELGWKSIAINLSDIAAMGGVPTYFLISLGLPRNLPLDFVSRFYRGMKDGAKRYSVALVGGDTSLSPKIVVNICLLGEGQAQRLLFRKGAKVGDDLWVSGTLGDAALGLRILKNQGAKGKAKALIKRHLSPSPRLPLGQALARYGWATAAIDVSDGLLIDVSHLLEESKVGALIWEDRIPLSRSYRRWVRLYSKDPYRFALSGGEDYELLFAAPAEIRRRLLSLSISSKVELTRIGTILPPQKGLRVVNKEGKTYSPSRFGFDHFGYRSPSTPRELQTR